MIQGEIVRNGLALMVLPHSSGSWPQCAVIEPWGLSINRGFGARTILSAPLDLSPRRADKNVRAPGEAPQPPIFSIWPRVTPSWLSSFSSRQSWVPVISPRSSWRYSAIVCATWSGVSFRNSMRKWRAPSASSRGHVFGAGLRQGVEHRVAAAGVGLDRVLRAHAVAQLHVVPVAGPAAVGVVGARGEERAEHAVLHVKHGHVLVDGDLEPLRRRGLQAAPRVASTFRSYDAVTRSRPKLVR